MSGRWKQQGARRLGISICGVVMLTSMQAGACAEPSQELYIRIAEIEIDAARVDEYKAAVKEEIEGSIRLESGVLALYAVHDKHNPARVRVFEIYADEAAYQAHIRTPHFAKYKAAVQDIVKSLNLLETAPIALGSRSRVNAGANAP
jgi:quinol monooxygenase YgiN